MPFNVDIFASEIMKTGTLQNNKFDVRFSLPLFLFRSGSTESITLRADSVQLPGINLDTTAVNRYGLGPRQKVPFNVNFNDNTISFIEDAKNSIWNLFHTWTTNILQYAAPGGSSPTYLMRYKKDYQTDISIIVYNTDGLAVSQITMKEAFPISMAGVGLSWADKSNILKVNVQFTFREWYMDSPSQIVT